MNIKLVFLIFMIWVIQLNCIIGQEWMKYINTTDNYKTVINNIDQHFENAGKGRGSGYKQYMRWRYKMDVNIHPDQPIRNNQSISNREYKKLKNSAVSSNRETNGKWESLGPYAAAGSSGVGRINCLAFHPSDSNIMWAGAPNGGLWKTTDGGASWTMISNYFASLGISGIAVDYTNPNIIYILTGDGDGGDSFSIGVLKTTDGGINWNSTGLSFDLTSLVRGFFIKIHPTNPQNLMVGTIQGLYTTLNGGSNWTQGLASNWVWDLEFKPGNPSIYYLATNSGVAKVNGSILTFITSGMPTSYERIALAVTAAAPNNVYALFGGDIATPGIFTGFYLSTTSGDSYNLQSTAPNILGWDNGGDAGTQASYDLCIAVDATNASRIFIGGINAWTSLDSGLSWTRITHWAGSGSPYVHADFHNMYYLNSTLFACNDGGVYKTNNNGSSWIDLSNDLNIMQFYHIDFYDNTWLGGTQDNGTHSANYGNLTSSELHGGDGFGCTWHNSDHSIQFMTSQSDIVRRQAGTNLFINQVANAFWFTELSMGTTTNHVFANSGQVLLRGNQNVFPWDWSWPSTGSDVVLNDGIRGYQQGVNDPNVMYVVSGLEIVRTANIFSTPASWSVLTHPAPGTTLQNVTVDPANANRVWVVCSGLNAGYKVFKSETGGSSWINISGSLPNVQIRSIVYDTPGSDKIYIGTDLGVFFRNSTMSDWQYFSNNLPPANVSSLKIFGGFIYAGTFGRGIWRSPIYSSCPTNLSLTQVNDPGTIYNHGTQIHHASNVITNSRVISGNMGVEATYTAGNAIDFVEGFWAKTNTVVKAQIGSCPD